MRLWVGLARARGMSGRRLEQGPKLRSPSPSSELLEMDSFLIFLAGFTSTSCHRKEFYVRNRSKSS